eukprot:COSAG04_NODE_3966_length_2391_cov_1.774869_2_plen_55_part_00
MLRDMALAALGAAAALSPAAAAAAKPHIVLIVRLFASLPAQNPIPGGHWAAGAR